jgi:hypothetical protein
MKQNILLNFNFTIVIFRNRNLNFASDSTLFASEKRFTEWSDPADGVDFASDTETDDRVPQANFAPYGNTNTLAGINPDASLVTSWWRFTSVIRTPRVSVGMTSWGGIKHNDLYSFMDENIGFG